MLSAVSVGFATVHLHRFCFRTTVGRVSAGDAAFFSDPRDLHTAKGREAVTAFCACMPRTPFSSANALQVPRPRHPRHVSNVSAVASRACRRGQVAGRGKGQKVQSKTLVIVPLLGTRTRLVKLFLDSDLRELVH